MIGISRLYGGVPEPSDSLRYGPKARRRPVVVWNCTRRCNLRCLHCYARSTDQEHQDEMTTAEGFALLEDLAQFGVPVVLFSGGEPFGRPDLFELAERAVALGLRVVISTNGTLLDEATAARLQRLGVAYVGVSLDGAPRTHDRFRGQAGAYEAALRGIRNGLAAGVKIGLRFTITRTTVADLPAMFDLVRAEGIPRICFYHLVYAGRAAGLMAEDLDPAAARQAMDYIIHRTALLHAAGRPVEVLTVDNHADGPYLYLRMRRENHPRAERVLELLRAHGGGASGVGIGCVNWDGSVYPDQFWRHFSLGNVRQRPFSQIWMDESNAVLMKVRESRRHVKGRCAACRFLDACGGNFRVRAEAATGDLWAPDPACYLSDEEIRQP